MAKKSIWPASIDYKRLSLETMEFSSLTSKLLWTQLTNEAKSRYSFDLNWYESIFSISRDATTFSFHSSDDIEAFVDTYSVRRTCILRSFCLKTGLQLAMREYQYDSAYKSSRTSNECFTEDDIVNIYPVIKQVPPKVRSSEGNRNSLYRIFIPAK